MATPISTTSVPNAPYSRRAPSPPFIPVARTNAERHQKPLTLTPSFCSIDPGTLTEHDLAIVTGGASQTAVDRSVTWTYPMRHSAQSVLDFLYVGPQTVVKDAEWLSAQGITMVVLVHDVCFGGTIGRFAERHTAPLGVETVLVAAASAQDLMAAFDDLARAMSRNVVDVHAREGRRGKVLVTCQTGNDRATVIAAAYLMSVFGASMVDAVNFVMAQRFCANFDEEAKRCLSAWEAILTARRDVHGARAPRDDTLGAAGSSESMRVGAEAERGSGGRKRRIEDTRDEDDDMDMTDAAAGENMDADRYFGREAFIPFVDKDG